MENTITLSLFCAFIKNAFFEKIYFFYKFLGGHILMGMASCFLCSKKSIVYQGAV